MTTSRHGRSARALAQRMANGCLGMRARRLNRLVTRIYDEALRPHGITAAQLNVLVGIAVSGPVQAAALGRALDLEKSTLSRNLSRLLANGWVSTSRELELTAEGERLIEGAFPSWASAQKEVKQCLGDRAIPTLDAMTREMRER
jgi:DNA-binding MarR family transcriptional regulator